MAGVTILQTVTPIAEVTVLISGLCLAVFCICAVIAIIFYCNNFIKDGIIFTIVSVLGMIVALTNLSHPMYDKTQYQIIIDDSVVMSEFTQRYNIIEQEGITYWVTEK